MFGTGNIVKFFIAIYLFYLFPVLMSVINLHQKGRRIIVSVHLSVCPSVRQFCPEYVTGKQRNRLSSHSDKEHCQWMQCTRTITSSCPVFVDFGCLEPWEGWIAVLLPDFLVISFLLFLSICPYPCPNHYSKTIK